MPEPIIYVLVHTPQGDVAVKYEGMGIQVISNMLTEQGLTANTVSQEEYDAFVAAHS